MASIPIPDSKRHSRLSSSERRRLIVETAMRLFAERGFRGVTTRELAAEVGVSEPTLYLHFATKRDLYSAIIEELAGPRDQEEFQAIATQSGDDRTYFLTLAHHLFDWHVSDPSRPRLLLFSALEGHELSEQFHTHRVVSFFETLATHIRSRIEAKAFREVDPLIAARAFCGMIAQYAQSIVLYKRQDSAETQQATLVSMVDLFLNGLQAK